mmetsp:Transcript_92115/g.214096  ORF Transcript_92115/g.214096 Transcript_92115/m.214096 type:complete len:408 (-) Transcript_92115:50-1273(-)
MQSVTRLLAAGLLCLFLRMATAAVSRVVHRGHNRRKQLGLRGSQVPRAALVLKAVKCITPWHHSMVERYHRQLARHGVEVAILRDISGMSDDDGAVHHQKYRVRDSFVYICDVSWNAAKNEFGHKALQNVSPKSCCNVGDGAHNAFEALWWKRCAPFLTHPQPERTWYVESDAIFNGDVSRFVLHFSDNGADLISSGLRLAGKHWWQYPFYEHSAKFSNLKSFGRYDDLVHNVPRLPELNEGLCREKSTFVDFETPAQGFLLFHQDHVIRMSSRLQDMMLSAISKGVLGPAEVLAPMLCANRYGLKDTEHCSIFDFAPLRNRSLNATYVSTLYCWPESQGTEELSSLLSDGSILPCDASWQDRWIHPVKNTRAGWMCDEPDQPRRRHIPGRYSGFWGAEKECASFVI